MPLQGGDGDSLQRNEPPPLVNIAHFINTQKKIKELGN
jgi:hypothetical protein